MEDFKEIGACIGNSTKKRIVFFVKQGLDSFLKDIVEALSQEYETKKIVVKNLKEINVGMEWADICWFEWCDELVSYGSKLDIAKEKIIVCRLHSYEAFTEYPSNVVWENVDKIIFVGENIKSFVIKNFNLNEEKTIVIQNGVNKNQWNFAERAPGFNIAYVGYINYKKGPMLLLHTFKAIYDKNNKYKLFIAGKFQDHRDVLYFNQMIKEFGLENNVIYEGWQDNLDNWLENKNYVLCTSVLESQNMSVMQAMQKGIKPIIHNFVGAKNIYPEKLVWNDIKDAVYMVTEEEYNSKEYALFIEGNYGFYDNLEKIKILVEDLAKSYGNISIDQPLVTVGITNYNGKEYLESCVESFLNQTYSNIEILFVDDNSTDGSKEIIEEYVENYKNARAIYHSTNSGGASKGIQEIINNARGKYLQWIACDDFVEKDAIERFVNYLEKNPNKDYVFSSLNVVNEKNMKVQQWDNEVYTRDHVIRHIFRSASGLIPMNCLYRVNFFKKNNVNWIVYRENDFSADTLNSIHFIKYDWNYGKINKPVINYRIHSNNLSYNLSKRIKGSLAIFDYIIKNFSEEVYAPEIPWGEVENKSQFKNLVLAQFYFDQIKNHVNMNAIPKYLRCEVSKEDLMKYCYIFFQEGMKFLEEGLSLGDTYLEELNRLKEKYNNYDEEIEALGVVKA